MTQFHLLSHRRPFAVGLIVAGAMRFKQCTCQRASNPSNFSPNLNALGGDWYPYYSLHNFPMQEMKIQCIAQL
jgi:hypothetical protein